MTNSQVSQLRKGDRLTDGRSRFTVLNDARPEVPVVTAGETWQVIAISDSGNVVVRLTYRETGEWRVLL